MERGWVNDLFSFLPSVASLPSVWGFVFPSSGLPLPTWAFEADCPAAEAEAIFYEESDSLLAIGSTRIGLGTVKLTEHHLCWTIAGGTTFAFLIRNVVSLMASNSLVHCDMYARSEHSELFFPVILSSKVEAGRLLFHAVADAMTREELSIAGEAIRDCAYQQSKAPPLVFGRKSTLFDLSTCRLPHYSSRQPPPHPHVSRRFRAAT